MNELTQFKDNSGKVVYSARELHAYLGSEKKFTDWFKYQIESLNLVDRDYSELIPKKGINSEITRKRGRPAKDYALTLTTVLTITARANQPGTEMTKALAQDVAQRMEPSVLDYARALVRASDENKGLKECLALSEHKTEEVIKELEGAEKRIQQQEPKVEYYNRSVSSAGTLSLSETIKVLNFGWKDGRNKFCRFLRAAGIFFQNKNEPKQEYIAKGYFKLHEQVVEHKILPDEIILVATVTPLGIKRLSEWMRKCGFDDEAKVDKYIEEKEKEFTSKHSYKGN